MENNQLSASVGPNVKYGCFTRCCNNSFDVRAFLQQEMSKLLMTKVETVKSRSFKYEGIVVLSMVNAMPPITIT